jgi:hypothetical protein
MWRTWRLATGGGPRGRAIAGTLCVLGSLAAAVVRADDTTLAEEQAFRAAVARVAGAVVRLEPGASVAGLSAAADGGTVAGPATGLVVADGAGRRRQGRRRSPRWRTGRGPGDGA